MVTRIWTQNQINRTPKEDCLGHSDFTSAIFHKRSHLPPLPLPRMAANVGRAQKDDAFNISPRRRWMELQHVSTNPKGPNNSLEGALGLFLGVKPILRRYLDPQGKCFSVPSPPLMHFHFHASDELPSRIGRVCLRSGDSGFKVVALISYVKDA